VGCGGRRERTFIEYVPKTLKPDAPLLLVLHLSGGDASGMRDNSNYEFAELADKYGFLVVYSDGFENTRNDCREGSPFSSGLEFWFALCKNLALVAQIPGQSLDRG
jgi:polyhydroxybutyrate depolymerase